MSVKITDCTIRDGGYLLDKNSDQKFVMGVMEGLAKAGIDFVETGFLQSQVNGESIVYRDSKDVRKYLPKGSGRTEFLGFCDNSRYSADKLDDYDGKAFKWLRISFAKHEIDGALAFCDAAQKKGYIVQFNPMDAVSYSDEERKLLIQKVNEIKPGSLSIVDTFGAMYLEDLIYIFKQMDQLLDKSIHIGLHSHDNLGLSCALAEIMVMLAKDTERDVIIDGSLFGMGRGAGNASTELLANYLNKKCGANYNIPVLLDTIDKHITPLCKNIHWGYDLPMFICGAEHAHVDNIYYLQKLGCGTKDMYQTIGSMMPQHRTRYGTNYLKSDFSVLQKAYDTYRNSEGYKK